MIEWTIDEQQHLVKARVVGNATPEHFEAYLSAITAANAAPYRKLFSIVGSSSVASGDIPAFAALVLKSGRNTSKIGPVAIVVASRETNLLADWFRSLASLERPVRIFQHESTAMAWLDGIAPPPSV
ncbi:MAG: hypothetical protein JO055_04210 [Alphaproteobacteria bacterium]|nr:hypothetical protein [Alphaproteobacteria bacterium]